MKQKASTGPRSDALAKFIDHTLLKADAKAVDIARLCCEAKECGFKSVCVNPCWVSKCREALKGTKVGVCTVIGFPLGATSTLAKVEEALQAIADGADELDVVLNQGMLKSDVYACHCELSAIVRECRAAREGVILKLILECCNLTKDEIVIASTAAKKAGFDFVKTSTGFGKGGATLADVRLMRKTVGAKMGVKAAGGIRDRKTALAMIRAGANRIGTSCGLQMRKLVIIVAAAILAAPALSSSCEVSVGNWAIGGTCSVRCGNIGDWRMAADALPSKVAGINPRGDCPHGLARSARAHVAQLT